MTRLSSWHQGYIRFIVAGLWANEKILFYPKLAAFYSSRLPQKPVILDVGANKGQSIKFFKKHFPAAIIHAFEPNKNIFSLLESSFKGNQVHLYPLAVSDSSGETTFYESILDETSSLEKVDSSSSYMKMKSRILLSSPDRMIKATYPVKIISLDEFIDSKNISSIDLIKIDVEGHEPAVLRGLSKSLLGQSIRFLQLEEHRDDQYADSERICKSILAETGYKEVFRLKHGFGNFYEVVYEKQAS